MRSRTLLFLFPVLVLAGVLAAGCGGSSKPKAVPADGAVVVGDDTIAKSDVTQLLGQAEKSYSAQKRKFPKQGSAQYKALQDQAIQYLVQQDEFKQKADELGIQVGAAQVQSRLRQIKKQYFGGSEKKYRQQLKTQGLTQAQVENDIRTQLLSEAIFKKVTKDVKVSEADAKAYYSSHKSQYSQPESRDVRHILVNSKPLAERLYAQLKGGADFATLAKKYSKDPGSAPQGGKLTISKGQTVPEFDKTAFALKTNQLAAPVHTQYGWHIIQALSPVRPAKVTPFEKVKSTIMQQLLQQKKNDTMTKWVNDTKKSFCAGKIGYQTGYAPTSDPCATLTTSTATTNATTT